MNTRQLILVLLLGLFCCPAATIAAEPKAPHGDKEVSSEKAPSTEQKPAAKITISKETTFITGPLREDGSLDFVAAINARASAGVTPENNAAIPFWRILGPEPIDARVREEYFRLLGMEPLPVEGEYFYDFDEYVKLVERGLEPGKEQVTDKNPQKADEKRQKLSEQYDSAEERLWRATEFPILSAWLAKNDASLDRLMEAIRRPRFYSPVVLPEGELPGQSKASCPAPFAARPIGRALLIRAMLLLGEQKFTAAEENLIACHRLALLIGQGPDLIDTIVAHSIDGMAHVANQNLSQSGKLSSQQLLAYAAQLRALPPIPPGIDRIDYRERLGFVQAITRAARGDWVEHVWVAQNGKIPEALQQALIAELDWDGVLRLGNSWFDRFVAASRQPDALSRRAAVQQLRPDWDSFIQVRKDWKVLAARALAGGAKRAGTEALAALLIYDLEATVSHYINNGEQRALLYPAQTQIGLALAAYQLDHGKYPAALADLQPDYLPEIPLDSFVDEPFRYVVTPEGCIFYSVGPNGLDEGGRSLFGTGRDQKDGADDVAIRIQPAK